MSTELQERLARLQDLLDTKIISFKEFEDRRRKLLDEYLGAPTSAPDKPVPAPSVVSIPDEDSQYPRRDIVLSDLRAGMEIGPADNRFRLVREIGGGAMGRVWLAHDLEEEKLEGGEHFKALKVVNPVLQDAPRALKMLKQEAIRASRLTHPNIINVRGWRQGPDGWLFVVMDYLEGRDLDRLLLERGKPGVSWELALKLAKSIADGLDYAHAQDIIHRDLKPGNVFITHAGEIKILDFGLAYRLHRSVSMINVKEHTSGGTIQYMPPESFVAGEPDRRRDVYSLACLIYEMLTGETPYTAEAAVYRSPNLLPSKPQALTEAAWEVLKLGLAYNREDRIDSAGELIKRLELAQTGGEPLSPGVPDMIPTRRMDRSEIEAYRPEAEPPVEPAPAKAAEPAPRRSGRRVLAIAFVMTLALAGVYLFLEREQIFIELEKSISDLFGVFPGRDISVRPVDKVKDLQRQTAEQLGVAVEFLDTFKDGSYGPALVVIPAGVFQMGSPEDEVGRDSDENQHQVRISKSFAIGKFEVTYEEYDRFAEATGRDKPSSEGWGRGRLPVINVSWHDATAYAEWLSEQAGRGYRLPTEAEWEYAARAGTATPFHFGATINTDQANYDGTYTYAGGPQGVYRGKPLEVGQFPANAWGMHDAHGNVWEWTCSEYYENYGGRESRCADKNQADSSARVYKGGSWNYWPRDLRSANRGRLAPQDRHEFVGFRVVRTF